MRIVEIEQDSRPREKMLALGPGALSNTELLCVLLKGGSRACGGAPELAGKVLALSGGSLAALSRLTPARLCMVKGIGLDKSATIAAAFELGRRCADEALRWDRKSVCGPRTVYDMMIPHMKGLDHEECWCVFLNASQFVLARELLFVGGMESTVIDSKMIVRRALELRAFSVVLVHNHPSGNPSPSKADRVQTACLKDLLETMDMSLVDHVIVSDDSYYSFSEGTVARSRGAALP